MGEHDRLYPSTLHRSAQLAAHQPESERLATNRFGNTERALAFVEALYARGATEVLVDDPGVDSTGEPYADTLIVTCEEWSSAQHRIEQFCEKEGPGDLPPEDFTMDRTSGDLRLWWD